MNSKMYSKEYFVNNLESHLAELRRRTERPEARPTMTTKEATAAFNKWIRILQFKILLVEQKIAELKEADNESWDETRLGAEVAWHDLNEVYIAGLSRFK